MKVWRNSEGREFPAFYDSSRCQWFVQLYGKSDAVHAFYAEALGYELVEDSVSAEQVGAQSENDSGALIEALAEFAHERWSRWMIHMFGKSSNDGAGNMVVPKDLANRWARQAGTKYAGLTDEEKRSDRKEADLLLESLATLGIAPESGLPQNPPNEAVPEEFEVTAAEGFLPQSPFVMDNRLIPGKTYVVREKR